jgi:hypothetical protein
MRFAALSDPLVGHRLHPASRHGGVPGNLDTLGAVAAGRGSLCATSVLAGTRDGSCLLAKEPITVPRRNRTMQTTTQANTLTVKIVANDKGNPAGKLADAELHFTDGPMAGLKLIGFAIWERRSGGGRNVTFPARQYNVNGERRSFALLRPLADAAAQDAVRDRILEAYAEYEEAQTADA